MVVFSNGFFALFAWDTTFLKRKLLSIMVLFLVLQSFDKIKIEKCILKFSRVRISVDTTNSLKSL